MPKDISLIVQNLAEVHRFMGYLPRNQTKRRNKGEVYIAANPIGIVFNQNNYSVWMHFCSENFAKAIMKEHYQKDSNFVRPQASKQATHHISHLVTFPNLAPSAHLVHSMY